MSTIPEISYFQGDVPSIDTIRQKLSRYEGGEIKCEKNESDGIAMISINHPERRNAISGKMMVDFENIVNDLETWNNGKAVLIYGANGIFCSGGDLNLAKNENTPQFGYEMASYMQSSFQKFCNLPLVSVAYIDGIGALGGGAEFITACDFRLCASNEKTKIGFVHSKMGIIPAWGGTQRLVNILGKRKALDLLLTGRLLNAEESRQIGLVDEVVDDFQQAYKWLLDRIKAHSSVTRAVKASVTNAIQTSQEISETEKRIFAPLWGGLANREALSKNLKHK